MRLMALVCEICYGRYTAQHRPRGVQIAASNNNVLSSPQKTLSFPFATVSRHRMILPTCPSPNNRQCHFDSFVCLNSWHWPIAIPDYTTMRILKVFLSSSLLGIIWSRPTRSECRRVYDLIDLTLADQSVLVVCHL